jgi:hypothetical protein
MIKIEDITSDDYKYIKLVTKLITPNDRCIYVAEVVYDDGWGMSHVLKRSISSVLEEAIEDVIAVSGMGFLKDVK